MNRLTGTITQIQQSGTVLLVDIDVHGHCFSALLIEASSRPSWILEGETIDLAFKETEVSLARNLQGTISTRNRMMCKVTHVERGVLISKITLAFQSYRLVSAVTTRALDSLHITKGDDLEALVKANELTLIKKN